jgi:hypothetical protein
MIHQDAITLDDLVGTHVIDGVGEFVVSTPDDPCSSDARVFLLRLDGHVHAFREDANDGYRSMLRVVEVLADDHADVRRVVSFAPRPCRFDKRAQRLEADRTDDVLVVTDDATGSVLLEIGTENTDDYYPSFISHWTPIKMGPPADVQTR